MKAYAAPSLQYNGAVPPPDSFPTLRAIFMPVPTILHDRLRLPIIGAPMFIVSTPALVMAQCKAGIVGSFPALNARPASQLDEWLAQISEELAADGSPPP